MENAKIILKINRPSRIKVQDFYKNVTSVKNNLIPSIIQDVTTISTSLGNIVSKQDDAERKNKELVQRLAVTEFNLSDPVQYPKGKKGKKGNSGTNEIDTGVVYNPKTGKFEIKNKDGKKKDNSGFSFKISDPNKGKPRIEYKTVYNPKTNKFENVKIEQENMENKDKKKTSTADELRRFREFEKKGTEKVEVKEAFKKTEKEKQFARDLMGIRKGTHNNKIDEIVSEVIRGEWGNGGERRRRLEQAGYDYETIQSAVNCALGFNNIEPNTPDQVETPGETPVDFKTNNIEPNQKEQVETPEDTPVNLKPDNTGRKDPEQVENPEDKPADLKPDDTETKDPEQVENPEDKPADLKPDDTTTTPEETENPEDKPADLKPDDTTTTPEETENPEDKPADLKPDDTTTTPEETENPEDKPADLKPDDTATTPEETEKTEDTSANLKPDDAETKSPEQNPNEEDEGIRYKEKISSNTQSSGGITGGNATTGKVEKTEEE